MFRSKNHTAAVLLATVVLSGLLADSYAAERVRPAAYISADFCGALVIHPQRMAKSPLLETVPLKTLPAIAAKEAPPNVDVLTLLKTVKPDKILRVIILADPYPAGELDVLPGVIVQYTEDIDGAAALAALLKDPAAATHNGKSYLRGANTQFVAKLPLCGHVADVRTLVFGAEPTMKRMLSARVGDNPLLERMKKTTLKHDLIVEFVVSPLIKALEKKTGKTFAEVTRGNPDDPVGQMAKMITGLSLTLDLSGDTLITANATGANDLAATQMEAMAKQGVEMARKQFEMFKPMIAKSAPPNLVGPINALVEQVAAGLTVSRSGRDVNVVLPMPAALLDLARNAGKELEKAGAAP
jgi:hypothetical protein